MAAGLRSRAQLIEMLVEEVRRGGQHDEAQEGRAWLQSAGSAKSFLGSLAALDDADRWYHELTRNGHVLLPCVGDVTLAGSVLKYVDARMVPWLLRYAGAGSDAFLEVLCTMARQIDGAAIDSVLAALFRRWTTRFFNHRPRVQQHAENHALWRALGRLSGHPRFALVRDHESQLAAIRGLPIPWFHKREITQILERSPHAYTDIEAMLFKAAEFEHWFEDEVDRLDDAADRLFNELPPDE